ncbi:MAG: heavy-metal-associated domain-containing protein [Nocardioidaceae bacterium]
MMKQPDTSSRSVVMELDGLHWATQRNAVEAELGRRPGVVAVEANPSAQTATVTYDPSATNVEELARWIQECGYHCRGESVPDHTCAPAVTDASPTSSMPSAQLEGHIGHDMRSMAAAGDRRGTPADVMGHGGHGEMSMDSMVRDMRNRLLVC